MGAADRPRHERRRSDRDRRPWLAMPAAGPGLKLIYALMAVLVIAYLVSELLRRNAQSWPAVDAWGVTGFELAGSALCIARAFVGRRRTRSARAVPLVLGLGLMMWSAGDLVLAVNGASGPATPLLANVFYIGFYPLSYVGVMLLVHLGARRLTAEMWLDGLIAGLGAAAVVAAFLFHTILRAAGGDAQVVTTNLAFPIGDLLLLALVIGGSAVLPGRRRLPWMLLAVGLAVNTLGDTANLFASGLGASHAGGVADAVAWPTSILLVSLSVWISPSTASPIVSAPRPSFVLPLLACVLSMAMLSISSIEHISAAALALALATLAAAGVRAGLSVRALRRLTLDKHRQAVTDQLTTLANRRALIELLEALEQEHANTGERRQLACLFVDLNRFKEVNDSFGHSVGDELLRQLGARLEGILRKDDLLARLGGDEFVVAMLDADGERGAVMAQRIGARLHEPFQLGAVRAQIGASIGIAVAPSDATAGSDLMRCADLAMYRAKLAGQPFAIYNEELDGRGNRMGLVEDLRAAIAAGALELHYQPQIECASGEIVAIEALVRWNHPRLGYVPPLEFLPLAEDAELIDPLTELVLDMALAQCARWRAAGYELSVSVNLSSTNLHNPRLAALVGAALDTHGVPPSALVLEVTETMAITNFKASQQTIRALHDLGLVVSVDDFGAGFTSLAYLSSLAVGELKLDRSFIQGLVGGGADGRNEALVRSTIELAHALGLRVVAEGIEDEESFELLAELGSDLAQGYLISRPRPAGELDLDAEAFQLPSRALPATR
ncbi:MAG: EAL domain-containing protein [Acidobacteriota bacterium]|nr:EAL domain-containing protein [Acidobacteriota bacterium]